MTIINKERPINESLDPRFGKTSPQNSLLRNAVKVINGVAVVKNNGNNNQSPKGSNNDNNSR